MGRDYRRIAMGASMAVAFLMLAGKLLAYAISGSMAILSDAAESVIHLFATTFAAVSLWTTQRPSTEKHPYGFGKLAYFSAGFEGALIMGAAIYILVVSVEALLTKPDLRELGWGLAITAALGLVNLALGVFLVQVGRRQNSLILQANGKHVLTDMWTSAAVVVGVAIVWGTGIEWLDPVIAIAAGLNILVSAFFLMRKSLSGLMDEADPGTSQRILAVLQEAVEQELITGYHQLRHRESHDEIWVEVHMLLPGAWTTTKAHENVTQVEKRLRDLFDKYEVHVTTHIEPTAHERAHPGGHAGLHDPFAPLEESATPVSRKGSDSGA